MEKLYEFRDASKVRPGRLSDRGIHDLAVDIVTNVVYIANDANILDSFPILGMADRKALPKTVLLRTGAFYELRSKASRLAVNGRPQFFSVRLLHKDDLGPLLDEIDRLEKALAPQEALA